MLPYRTQEYSSGGKAVRSSCRRPVLRLLHARLLTMVWVFLRLRLVRLGLV